MRDLFAKAIVEAYEKQPFIFLTGDLGYAALEPVQKKLGKHFINAGVAEQNMMSVAAGLAREGRFVWVYSIAPFAYARPYEQIRNDICLHDLPVGIVGNGGGYGYGVMGATHHAIEDYGALLCLQNMQAFVPAFNEDVAPAISRMLSRKRPGYLRLGYAENVEAPAYAPWRKALSGKRGIVIGAGAIASSLISTLQKKPEAERPGVWVVCELPLTELDPALITDIQKASAVCVAEEHVAQGGLGQMLAAKLLSLGVAPKKFLTLNAQGYPSGRYGSQGFHRSESGLTEENLLKALAAC